MTLKAVGLLSPGDMGHVVGKRLLDHGMTVLTCLEGRSERTKGLAHEAGITSVPTYGDLIQETDLLLSILVPAQALNVAGIVARALDGRKKQVTYVDCNAVAPARIRAIEKVFKETGTPFVDASILGPPPRKEGTTRFYASGPDTRAFEALKDYGLDIRVIGSVAGQASGLKMCYAALTKGTTALSTALLVAARRMGLYDALIDELEQNQSDRLSRMEKTLPQMPPKSRRWVGEMEEIAKTFEDCGVTPKIHQGAADLFRFVGENRLAEETPETYDKKRTLEEMIEILALAR